jgi:hypothetical protein
MEKVLPSQAVGQMPCLEGHIFKRGKGKKGMNMMEHHMTSPFFLGFFLGNHSCSTGNIWGILAQKKDSLSENMRLFEAGQNSKPRPHMDWLFFRSKIIQIWGYPIKCTVSYVFLHIFTV